jgi:hypothetical protein
MYVVLLQFLYYFVDIFSVTWCYGYTLFYCMNMLTVICRAHMVLMLNFK